MIAFVPAIMLAVVLITPGCSDDVDALAHLQEEIQSQVHALSSINGFHLSEEAQTRTTDNFIQDANQLQSQNLLCSYRC